MNILLNQVIIEKLGLNGGQVKFMNKPRTESN